MVWLEFELIYFDVIVQHVSPYTTSKPPSIFSIPTQVGKPSLRILCTDRQVGTPRLSYYVMLGECYRKMKR